MVGLGRRGRGGTGPQKTGGDFEHDDATLLDSRTSGPACRPAGQRERPACPRNGRADMEDARG
ncbi:hypothetical protein B7R77_23720 [Ralstonia solanacearum K60]|uniref:Uncharacterized protein n=1 Tax=Ralstonia solanacearum K60 TaxID=1091042 RepID=A0AAP7ZJY3_RALSL|nr:hypothetical protein B7R77_23720 [Ralstonia solanacearum K60]RIJ84277.1 hypothetical protein RSP822_22765 [Ralstonia solanacearum]